MRLEKILMGFTGLILLVMATFIVLKSNSDIHTNTEEKVEMDLLKSMEETEHDKAKLEKLLTKIPQEVNDKGYGQIGLSFTPDDRILTVQASDRAFAKANRRNIEDIIFNIASDIGFQNFEVDFMTLDSYPVISQEENKLNETLSEAAKITSELLKKNGYEHTNFSISAEPKKEIVIEVTGGNLENKDSIEKLISNKVYSKTNLNFAVKIKTKSKGQIRDQEWQPVFSAIVEETNKEFEEYRGFAYSFHPEPLQIIIKTNVDAPKWFWSSDKEVKQIEHYVEKIIKLKCEELSIEEIPYKIIIRASNNKKIN